MIIKVPSLAFSGIDIVDVDVQVQIEPGIPKFIIVGLADKTIAESKERVRAALSSIGLSFPAKKILINLAPADLIKEGSRFDLHIEVGNSADHYNYDHILGASNEEPRVDVAARVKNARRIQEERYEGYDIRLNNMLDGQLLIDYAIPGDEGRDILNEAAKKLGLSMRAYNRVLRVASTIADLAESKYVNKMHISEALSYRQMDFAKEEMA